MKVIKNLIVLLIAFYLTLSSCNARVVNQACKYPGYSTKGVSKTANGYEATLNLISPGPYGNDIKTLDFQLTFETQQIFRVRITDPNNQRWEVPFVNKLVGVNPDTTDYLIQFTNAPFGFSATRISTGEVLFNSTPPADCSTNGLIYSDYYLELSTSFSENNPNIYGLGERTSQLRLLNNFTYTLFAKDQGTASTPNINLYGSHPFYLNLASNGNANGVFLLNSNAMDVQITSNSLTYKVVGGIFDFFFFTGPTPNSVIQQYTQVIGTTHMPTYWSLGFHNCRWGYHSIAETAQVVANYSKFGIPLETMWNDIDYMDQYRDFSTDPVNFAAEDFTAFVDSLHANNQHYMMIVDPGISNTDPTYQSYIDLVNSGAYIKAGGTDAPLVGSVWPGYVIFPDFLHPNATEYWTEQFANFHKIVPFDGIWIDMNEISNFCDGNCFNNNHKKMPGFDPNYPPYIPGGSPLYMKTINMTSTQYNNTLVYNSHSIYGYTEGMATQIAAQSILGTRSTIISRSTFPGTGGHFAHWLGDNESSYNDLYFSIPGMLAMNMFGIPLVGADICGFNGNSNAELCGRWLQLGNFYPFTRVHNSFLSIPQEPWVWGQQVVDIAIKSINTKLTLLPFYYTLFHISHLSGDPVVRPLFFEYPTDSNTVSIDKQFLVGTSLLVSPVLEQGAVTVNAYFPDDIWYEYGANGSLVESTGFVTLDAPFEKINVHLRGGNIIPTQPTSGYVPPPNGIPITTTIARKLPFTLIVALDSSLQASGQLFLDDGSSLQTYVNNEYSFIEFNVVSTTSSVYKLQSSIVANGYNGTSELNINNIEIYGSPNVKQVLVNGNAINTFDSVTETTLIVSNLSLPLSDSFEIDFMLN
ncbi:hypothetical protein DICPUDRAFT_157944 [Dictyostelium purpureum]|uniref:Maltase n=1 Tax=Dictyostelium purpureum TaxID=5786 RepID=F1A0F0_DICPU|nr:uncharacterized protein DICPUDRAFT_157944 [Dictyostelium purpureum]EGC30327.1 hypothetical protein DICPUDRAFT_157944 [Dictyostelium purpureum]|eukprot:XP_003293150.1 hypothetical protein DICPUDRAFT_157944 [Dictyostelium purpureum]